jgi:preprotein translocase subunit SecD
MAFMNSSRHLWVSLALIAVCAILVWRFFVAPTAPGFRFGLDLVGGTELVYRADTSEVDDIDDAMESLKEVIERRVNIFGVSEPLVQTERAGLVSGNEEERLIVELPGFKDVEEAKTSLGQTPTLEFMLIKQIPGTNTASSTFELVPTGLTGRYLNQARVEFNQTTGVPLVSLEFDEEGGELFANITRENKGQALAIILDGAVLSSPIIQDEISDGLAQITGAFSPEEARDLVRNLNYGALPVPIELVASQTIGATLGEVALDASARAGVIGFIALSIFLVLWYRLPGLISVFALVAYVIFSLTLFKLIPVTLTAAAMAGFILSIGMAVDANVLIFERAKEELKKGKSISEAFHEGFSRAWLSIRDSNIASLITAVILFWLGTSAVKGFALTLGVGVLVSMFTAVTVSRTLLFAIVSQSREANESGLKKFLFSNGLHFK